MRKKRAKPAKKNNLKLLGIFMLAVFVLLFLSGCIKLASIIAKSQFDGSHRFTIAAVYSSTEATYISVSPKDGSASILHVTSQQPFSPGIALAVPTDSILARPVFASTDQNPADIFQSLVLHVHDTRLTIVDAFRLFVVGRSADVKNEEIHLPLDASQIDAKVLELFKDPAISDENISIEIVNATDVSGLGNRLARLLSNMGANVVAVKSSDKIAKSSIGYIGKPSYTVTRLQKLLHFPATTMQTNAISDIIITIGDDASQPKAY